MADIGRDIGMVLIGVAIGSVAGYFSNMILGNPVGYRANATTITRRAYAGENYQHMIRNNIVPFSQLQHTPTVYVANTQPNFLPSGTSYW